MTTTLSTNGRVTIPSDIRVKRRLRQGQKFVVLCSSTGDILLRPLQRRGKGLVKSLGALRGLELKRVDEPVRDVTL